MTDKLFDAIDADKSNSLSVDEVKEWFGHQIPGLTALDKKRLFYQIKVKAKEDGDNELTRREFAQFFKGWNGNKLESASSTIVAIQERKAAVARLLNEFDRDESGTISKKEAEELLNPARDDGISEQIRGLFALLDPKKTGEITREALTAEIIRHEKLNGQRCPCIVCEFVREQIVIRREAASRVCPCVC